jgi:hypothetical protein
MQIDTEYQLAAYMVAIAVVVLAISGVVVVTADGPPDMTNGSDASDNGTVAPGQNISVTESEQIDLSVGSTGNETITFDPTERTCRGGLRVDDPDQNQTDIRVDTVSVTLISDHTDPFTEIERERFAELVWNDVSQHAGLAEYEQIEIRVNQYYETVEREEPLDTVGVRVRPVDQCLPVVEGEVSLDNRSVTVRSGYSTLEEIDLTITDTIGVLNDEERDRVERLVESDERASYSVQTEFNEPDQLNATVVEATNDGEVTLELSPPDQAGRVVVVRVDLESEAIVNLWTKVSLERIEGTDTVTVGDSNGNSTITLKKNGTATED